MNSLDQLFNPRSVAVIGASRNEQKLGHSILLNLQTSKFRGKLYPVNPNARSILKLKVYPSVSAIEGDVDLAIIAVPSPIVPVIAQECVDKKVKAIIIISAGFSEIGKDGRLLEDKVRSIIKRSECRLLGPNCLGLINTQNNLNATFAASIPLKGNIGFMSQSGAFCTAALDWASEEKLGFQDFVSIGNKADIDELDLLRYWKDQNKCKVIGIYLENILNGKEFTKLTYEVSKNIPLIILKPGKSQISKKAITSHTGGLAGEDKVISAALEQSGCIRVEGTRDLFDLMKTLSWQYLPEGSQTAIVSNAGGPSVISTDLISESSLKIAKFSKKVKSSLEKVMPSIVNVRNPLDIVGDALADRYKDSIDLLLKDKNINSLVVLLTPQKMTQVNKTAEVIVEASRKTNKVILASFIGGSSIKEAKEILQNNKIPTFQYPENAISVLDKIYQYKMWRDRHSKRKFIIKMPQILKKTRRNEGFINSIIKKASLSTLGIVSLEESMDILKLYNIKFPNFKAGYSREEAVLAAREIGYPVVLKLPVESFIHKFDIGGVHNNLESDVEVLNAYEQLAKVVTKKKKSNIKVHIQKFLGGGTEVMIGIKKDQSFGDVLVFGMGGIYTELFRDIRRRILPLNREEIYEMIKGTKVYRILNGYRGGTRKDIKSLIEVIYNFSTLALDYPAIEAIDVNPAIVLNEGKGCFGVDVKIFV